jgi:hypothetical protein
MATTFENKVAILGTIWMDYRDDVEFADFIQYNDLGLPLAYAITGGIVQSTPQAEKFVNETFDLLLAGLDIDEDTGFEDIEDLLS